MFTEVSYSPRYVSKATNEYMINPSPLTWLKKSTELTAIHSSRSSPGGNATACLKFPLPKVVAAYLTTETRDREMVIGTMQRVI